METMTNVRSVQKWTWNNIKRDLIQQGKLDKGDISIDIGSFKPHFFSGTFQDVAFTVSWVRDKILLVSMPEIKQELIDAFSAIVEYEPLASYQRDMYTIEWDKVDPVGRLEELRNEKKFRQL